MLMVREWNILIGICGNVIGYSLVALLLHKCPPEQAYYKNITYIVR